MIANELTQGNPAGRPIAAASGAGNQGIVSAPVLHDWAALCHLVEAPFDAKISHTDFISAEKSLRNALKKKDPFVLFGECAKGIRDDEHLLFRSAVTLDFDTDVTALFEALDWGKRFMPEAHLWHTTRSSTDDAPRLRVIVPLSRDVSADEYRLITPLIAQRFGSTLDVASIKPAQMMYLPVRNAGAPFAHGCLHGLYLDPDVVLEAVDETVRERASSKAASRQLTATYDPLANAEPPMKGFDLDDLRDALLHVSADIEEPEWVKVLWSIQHQFGRDDEVAREIAREWSATSDKFEDEAFEDRWGRAVTSPKGKPVTIRTLLHLAKGAKVAQRVLLFDAFLAQIAKESDRIELQETIPAAIANERLLKDFDRDTLAQVLQDRIKTEVHVNLDRRKLRRAMEPLVERDDDSHLNPAAINAKYPNTEFGNARRLFDRYGKMLMYTPEDGGWYRWTSSHWRRTPEAVIRAYAKQVVSGMLADRHEYEGNALVEYIKWCADSQRAAMIANMVSLLAAEAPLQVPFDRLDQQTHLLGVANGVVDLHDGTLHAAEQSQYITVCAGVAYNPEAKCPLFEKVVHDALFGDAGMIGFLKRLIGYSLLGDPKEDVMVIPFGGGSNGKSTILVAVQNVLGGHAKGTSSATFMTDGRGFSGSGSGPNEALLRLRGSRFVYMSEPEAGNQLRSSLVKSVTGGDIISARGVHAKHSVEFRPTWVIFMPTNHKPIVKDEDNGIWRRLLLIPFERNFETDGAIEKDEDLDTKLRAEYEGILAWCVEGALEYQRIGLGAPETVKAAHREYRTDMDVLHEWLADEWFVDKDGRVLGAELWASWESYATKRGMLDLVRSNNALTRRLQERGFKSSRGFRGREFSGLRRREVNKDEDNFLD